VSSGEIFTTQTKVRVPAAATVIVALASLVCAIAVLVNLVQSFTGSASTTRTVWTYTFLFASVVGVVILGRLRAFEDRRLIIDTSGMTVVDRRGSRSFPWTTLGSVAILHGGGCPEGHSSSKDRSPCRPPCGVAGFLGRHDASPAYYPSQSSFHCETSTPMRPPLLRLSEGFLQADFRTQTVT